MARRCGLAAAAALAWAASAGAQELPPPPRAYFNDGAGFVSPERARALDEKLRRFDQETGSQVVVAIFPKLPSASLEDFTVRTAQAWRVGRKELDNGAVLFVFVQDRKLRLEVGYGLEDNIPDVTAKRIIEDVVVPRLRGGDPAGGLEAGIDAILAAARGEAPPEPAGSAAPRRGLRGDGPSNTFWTLSALCYFVLLGGLGRGRSATYTRRGREREPIFSARGCLTSGLAYGAFLLLLWLQPFGQELKLALLVGSILAVVAAAVMTALGGAGLGGGHWSPGGSVPGTWGGGWSSRGGGFGGGGFSGGGGSFGGGGASGSW
jgi:uncharacterized protein